MIQTSTSDTIQSALRENIFPTDSIQPDLTGPIRPLKEVVDFPATGAELAMIILAVLILALTAGWLIYSRVFKKKPARNVLPSHNMLLEAEHELAALKTSARFLAGDYSWYEEAVCQVIRKFIMTRLHIDALRSTSQQLVRKLESDWPTSALPGKINSFLIQSDLIKFARAASSGAQARVSTSIAGELLKGIDRLHEPEE